MEKLQYEREELIEMVAIHLQNLHTIPPLCGKIWATLIIEGKSKGLTFDDLLEKLKVSKSSISTNLNLLLRTKQIYFTTKDGERKKYFKTISFSERLERMFNNLNFEKKLMDKIIDYKSKLSKTAENKIELENILAYKAHLTVIEKSTQKIITDLKIIEQKNTKNNT
ncbi:MAG TPA: hypothetical protein VKX31_03455 [Brumimicrobium sp.]|nr:hypothetical protein [Brumimicrobium sp.]